MLQACSRPPAPQEACSFVQNPDLQRVSWKGKLPIRLYLHNSVPVDAYKAIDRAIAEYNLNVAGGVEVFRIIARDVGGDLDPEKDGYSMLYWFNSWDPAKKSEQARTTIYWTGNEIFEADIRVNAHDFTYSYGQAVNGGEVDLDSLLVHELGHVLGLKHNPTHGSVMNFSLDRGQDRRLLGSVDQTNLKCEY